MRKRNTCFIGLLCALFSLPIFSQPVVPAKTGINVELLPGGKSFRANAFSPNAPAEVTGMKVGDVVTAINGSPINCPDRPCLVNLLAGELASTVTLTLDNGREIRFEREVINPPYSMGGNCKTGNCQNGDGEMTYDGPAGIGFYKGSHRYGLPHGAGTLWSDGTLSARKIYEGEFVFGSFQGKGKGSFELENETLGSKQAAYEGQWIENRPQGLGKLTYADGTTVQGFFMPDIISEATVTLPGGRKFDNCRVFTSLGVMWLKPGTKQLYWYDFAAKTEQSLTECLSGDCANGTGEMRTHDGTVYKGSFKNGLSHGRGKLTSPDGTVYEGEFAFDFQHGKGTLRWPDGHVFTGDFVRGIRVGKGKLVKPNGAIFEGDYFNNMSNGQGKMVYPDGSFYEGAWANGQWNGHGVYTDKSGKTFTGSFREGKMHGRISVPKGSGTIDVFDYENGQIVRVADVIWSSADWQRNQAEREQERKMKEQRDREYEEKRNAQIYSGEVLPQNVSEGTAIASLDYISKNWPRAIEDIVSSRTFFTYINDPQSYSGNMQWMYHKTKDAAKLYHSCRESMRLLKGYMNNKNCPELNAKMSQALSLMTLCAEEVDRCQAILKLYQNRLGEGSEMKEWIQRSFTLVKRSGDVADLFLEFYSAYKKCGG